VTYGIVFTANAPTSAMIKLCMADANRNISSKPIKPFLQLMQLPFRLPWPMATSALIK